MMGVKKDADDDGEWGIADGDMESHEPCSSGKGFILPGPLWTVVICRPPDPRSFGIARRGRDRAASVHMSRGASAFLLKALQRSLGVGTEGDVIDESYPGFRPFSHRA